MALAYYVTSVGEYKNQKKIQVQCTTIFTKSMFHLPFNLEREILNIVSMFCLNMFVSKDM